MSAYRNLRPVLRLFVDGVVAGEKGKDTVRRLRPELVRPDVRASKWKRRPDVQAAIVERQAYADGLEARVAKLEAQVASLTALLERSSHEGDRLVHCGELQQ